jgi:hypothetical protein
MTGHEIEEILGTLDASTVAAILSLSPDPASVVQAREWMEADDAIRRTLKHAPSGIVAQICDILAEEDAIADDAR